MGGGKKEGVGIDAVKGLKKGRETREEGRLVCEEKHRSAKCLSPAQTKGGKWSGNLS